VPFIRAESPVAGGPTESGLGDTTQSFFFSPKAPTAGGWIWAVGPVGFYPTASNSALGRKKWGLGPSVLLLSQANGWTYGALANHIWSVAGNDDRPDLSETFLQPFVSYTSPSATGISLNTESIYDWKSDQWTVPINLGVSQLVKFGAQPVSFQLIARKYVEKPAGGPDCGLSFTVTLLSPK